MNRDEVMALANQTAGQHWMDEAHVQRLAALVAAAEREECAKLAEISAEYTAKVLAMCIDSIRARSNP